MSEKPKIEIRVGSKSDISKIRGAFKFLDSIGIPYSFTGEGGEGGILSAHRTPQRMMEEARALEENGYLVSIAAAGGSAALPGMTASETLIPVVGLPVMTSSLGGIDSLLSIIQMPEGVPVGCVGIGQAESAAVLAAQTAYVNNLEVRNKIRERKGINRKLSEIDDKNLIGIIGNPTENATREKYEEFIGFVSSLGIESMQYSSKGLVWDFINDAEVEGAKALVVFSVYNNEQDSMTVLPKTYSRYTDLPVIGVPLVPEGYKIKPEDLHSMLCDISDDGKFLGHPIAGMGTNRIENAALYSMQICGNFDPEVRNNLREYRESMKAQVGKDNEVLAEEGIDAFL